MYFINNVIVIKKTNDCSISFVIDCWAFVALGLVFWTLIVTATPASGATFLCVFWQQNTIDCIEASFCSILSKISHPQKQLLRVYIWSWILKRAHVSTFIFCGLTCNNLESKAKTVLLSSMLSLTLSLWMRQGLMIKTSDACGNYCAVFFNTQMSILLLLIVKINEAKVR